MHPGFLIVLLRSLHRATKRKSSLLPPTTTNDHENDNRNTEMRPVCGCASLAHASVERVLATGVGALDQQSRELRRGSDEASEENGSQSALDRYPNSDRDRQGTSDCFLFSSQSRLNLCENPERARTERVGMWLLLELSASDFAPASCIRRLRMIPGCYSAV